jgi:protein-disulfide isomerase
MLNKTITKNIRVPIIATISAAIFLATALALLISLPVLQQYDEIFFVYGQTQGMEGRQQQITNAASSASKILSLLSLTSQGSPYQGSKSAPVTVIDFSDLRCHLCARYVKILNQRSMKHIFRHLPNRGFDSMPAALAAQSVLKIKENSGSFIICYMKNKGQLIQDGQTKII